MTKEEKFKDLIKEAPSTKERLFYSAVYLFSTKGYSKVGIRELCRSVNVKESSFYNHYKSKDDLFSEIIKYFMEISTREVFTKSEMQTIIDTGNVEAYFKENIKEFCISISNPLYCTLLQIIYMESYTNPHIFELIKNSAYLPDTEQVLKQMMEKGFLNQYDVKTVTVSYYYGLHGLMHDYLLREIWNEDTRELIDMMDKHVQLFVQILKKQDGVV